MGGLFKTVKEEHIDPIRRSNTISQQRTGSLNINRFLSADEEKSYFNRIRKNTGDQDLNSYFYDLERNLLTTDVSEGNVSLNVPTVREDKAVAKQEKTLMKQMSELYHHSDLCTVREYRVMQEYVKNSLSSGDDMQNVEDRAEDPYLMRYVETMLSGKIDMSSLSDEYLSDNIPKLYETARKCLDYPGMKQRYPSFFRNLPEMQRIALEERAAMGADLKNLLDSHMRLHGLEINEEHNAKTIRIRRDGSNKRERDRAYTQEKDSYVNLLKGFSTKYIKMQDIRIAELYTLNSTFNASYAMNVLEKELKKHNSEQSPHGKEIALAKEELNKAFSLRDKYIAAQRERIDKLRSLGANAAKDEIKRLRFQITKGNKEISLISRHADYYREFLDFCLGIRSSISRSTKFFLDREDQGEMLKIADPAGSGPTYEEKLQKIRDERKQKLERRKNDREKKQKEEFEELQHSPRAKDDYASFSTAVKNLGTVGRMSDKADRAVIKEALGNLKKLLDTRLENRGEEVDYGQQRTLILMVIQEFQDLCRVYMQRKQNEKRSTGNRRFENVEAVFKSSFKVQRFFESLSEDKFRNLKNRLNGRRVKAKDQTFARIMADADQANLTDEAESERARELVRENEHKELDLQKNFIKGDVRIYRGSDKKSISEIESVLKAGDELSELQKKAMPVNDVDFSVHKEKILGAYKNVIDRCRKCTDKLSDTDLSEYSVKIRRIQAIYERDAAYLRDTDTEDLILSDKRFGTWEDIFKSRRYYVRDTELDGNNMIVDPDSNESLIFRKAGNINSLDSQTLSKALGMNGLYRDSRKAVMIKSDGSREQGLLQEKTVLEPNIQKKGLKSYNDLLDYARHAGVDIHYSDEALRQLGTLKLMDFLTGVRNRDEKSLVYDAETTVVEGENAVSIKRIMVTGSFGDFGKLEEEEKAGLLSISGSFNLPYDTNFADRVMTMETETIISCMEELGASLSDEKKKCLIERHAALKEMLKQDKEKGWRSGIDDDEQKSNSRIAGFKDIRRRFKSRSVLPDYVKSELIRDSKKDYEAIDGAERLKNGGSPWVDADGNVINRVKFQREKIDIGAIEREIRNKYRGKLRGNNIEVEIRRLVDLEVAKRRKEKNVKKLDMVRSFSQTASHSAFLMKKSKDDLLKKVKEDRSALSNISPEMSSIMDLLSSYASSFATAQWEITDRWKRRQLKIDGETIEDRKKRISRPDSIRKEQGDVIQIREKIKNALSAYKDKKNLSPDELKEKEMLEFYKERFDKSCDGNLTLPEGNIEHIDGTKILLRKYDVEKITIPRDFEVMDWKESKKGNKNSRDVLDNALTRYRPQNIRPYDMRDDSEKPLFPHEPCMEDLCQGTLGDCYLIAAVAALVERDPSAIKNIMKDNGKTVTVKLHHLDGKPFYITMTKEVPTGENRGKESDAYGQSCLWLQMLEKAYTLSGMAEEQNKLYWNTPLDKIEADRESKEYIASKRDVYRELEKQNIRSYESISGGHEENVYRVLTGITLDTHEIEKKNLISSKKMSTYMKDRDRKTGKLNKANFQPMINEVMQLLQRAEREGSVVFCSSRTDFEDYRDKDSDHSEHTMRGVAGKHAYTALGIRYIGNKPYIAVRNPWGTGLTEHRINEVTGAKSSHMEDDFGNGAHLLTPLEFVKNFRSIKVLKKKPQGNP